MSMKLGAPTVPLSRRLWRRVTIDFYTGCWLWKGGRSPGGYGQLWLKGKNVSSHRAVYALFMGPIPDGLHLDHLCRVRHCCNPWHLEPVTPRENLLRGDTDASRRSKQVACKWGHPFDDANTYTSISRGRTYRTCKRCKIVKGRIYAAARKGVVLTHEEADY